MSPQSPSRLSWADRLAKRLDTMGLKGGHKSHVRNRKKYAEVTLFHRAIFAICANSAALHPEWVSASGV